MKYVELLPSANLNAVQHREGPAQFFDRRGGDVSMGRFGRPLRLAVIRDRDFNAEVFQSCEPTQLHQSTIGDSGPGYVQRSQLTQLSQWCQPVIGNLRVADIERLDCENCSQMHESSVADLGSTESKLHQVAQSR